MENIRKTIGLFEQEAGYLDIEIDERGDFRNDDSYDTEINISLKTDRRADKSEVIKSQNRRGWEGDVLTTLPNYLIGSKFWLNDQSRWTQDVANKYADDAEGCLAHFIQRGLADRVQASGTLINDGNNQGINLDIAFYVENNVVKRFTDQIWKNSEYAR